MNKIITWLHISDLHFCVPQTGWDARRVLDSLRIDLEKMEREHGLRPDLIFFTGDAGYGHLSDAPGQALPDQYKGVAEVFDGIRSAFTEEVPKENFFIVPGNHDVNRSYVLSEQNSWLDSQESPEAITETIKADDRRWRLYMDRLCDYRNFLEQNGYEHLLTDPSRLIYAITRQIRDIKVGIVGFNSAWSCGRQEREAKKLWMGAHWQIETLQPAISNADVKIALVHHPSNWLVEFEDPSFRRSIERDFDFCLHGHEHQEWVERADKHVRIAAGACYQGSNDQNGYNYARIDLEKGSGEVWLRHYDPRGGGWIPDIVANQTDNNGLWPLYDITKILPSSTTYVNTPRTNTKTAEVARSFRNRRLSYDSDPPIVVSTWVGRDSELHTLRAMKNGVVAVTGIGGQGKSSLVSKYLEVIRRDNPEKFWDWRDCREESERFHTQLIASIEHFTQGELTGEQLVGVETKEVIRYFFENFGERSGIFVLDNVDHYVNVDDKAFIQGVAALVNDAIRLPHNFLFILTCRPRVTYPSTRFVELHLSGLTLPEANELFRTRGVRVNEGTVQIQVKEIWERTEGHAFWLDLIATQMERSPSKAIDILEELRKDQVDDRALAMFKALWKGLHNHQRTVLRCMAEMKHSETEASIKSFTSSLIRSSAHFNRAFRGLQWLSLLVERKSGTAESKYDLHPIVRSFINKEFPNRQDREPYILPILNIIDRWIKSLSSPRQDSPSEVIDRWAYKSELELAKGDPVAALKSLATTADQLIARGLHEELFRIGTAVLEQIDWQVAQSTIPEEFQGLLTSLIALLAEQKREAEARSYLARYEAIISKGTASYIHFCSIACHLEWTTSNFEAATKWGREGTELKSRSQIDTHFDSTHNLALSLRDSGYLDEALKLFAPEQDIRAILTDDHTNSGKDAAFYGNIGRCLQKKGLSEPALICFVKSADLLYSQNHAMSALNRGYACLWIGEVLQNSGDLENAYVFYKNAANIWSDRAPIKADIALQKISEIQNKTDTVWKLASERDIDAHCRSWIKDYLKTKVESQNNSLLQR